MAEDSSVVLIASLCRNTYVGSACGRQSGAKYNRNDNEK